MADLQPLIDQISRLTGLDYAGYDPFVLDARIATHMAMEGLHDGAALEAKLDHDRGALNRLLVALAPEPEGLFSEPMFWRALRRSVIPHLRTYPRIQVWIPACGDGEAAYATAIMLREEGLWERSRIYATDVADVVLFRAKEGLLSPTEANRIRSRYADAGGNADFHEYWDGVGKLRPLLRDRIVFAQHNLATDASFNEFHLIICDAAALSDFRPSLELRIHRLLSDSMCRFGTLALRGDHRLPPAVQSLYQPFDDEPGLYRRGIE